MTLYTGRSNVATDGTNCCNQMIFKFYLETYSAASTAVAIGSDPLRAVMVIFPFLLVDCSFIPGSLKSLLCYIMTRHNVATIADQAHENPICGR